MKKGYSSIVNARNLEIVFFGGALGYLLALVVNKRACPPCAPCAAGAPLAAAPLNFRTAEKFAPR